MKKIVISILCLAFVSLACLQTGGVIVEPVQLATIAPTESMVATSAAEVVKIGQSATTAPMVCARVIADKAVNLRKVAAASDSVLTWLKRGDLVQVLDSRDPVWWGVRFEGLEGFARSAYLQIDRCEDDD